MKPVSDSLVRTTLLLALAAVPLTASADLSVKELRDALDAGEKITIIDVRLKPRYSKGHIPNAINVPASLVSDKRLPPMGRVVVCAEGLGTEGNPSAAVEALNDKPGIRAELLVGGYRAWKAEGEPTTEKAGLNPVVSDSITYQQLRSLDADAAVLVDLRTVPRANSKAGGRASEELTDLSAEFPGRHVVHDPFAAQGNSKKEQTRESPLLVLIDNGNGRAEKMYRALRANGNLRVVILMGGEEIIKRRGRAGSQRVGHGVRTSGGEGPRSGGRP